MASAPASGVPSAATTQASTPPVLAPRAQPADASGDDGARARALLEDRPASRAVAAQGAGSGASDPAAPRFVVQFGAFADAAAAHEARAKVERLGFKTYAQVVDTAAGKRTRVRVMPFANRADADKAAARIEAAGLTANVLTL
jgi:DedD protein